MKPTLIITRPAPDDARFAARVQAAVEVDVLLSPLQEIVPLPVTCDAAAFVFTSANGVAQAGRLGLTQGRAWCVGDRTAEMARAAGFEAISACGTVEDVFKMIVAGAPKVNIAHVRGKNARGDLAPRLRAVGIDCSDVIAYDQRALTLTDAARAMIEGKMPVIVPLFSPRSAVLLKEQVVLGSHVSLIAMSEAVAQVLPEHVVQVVSAPNGDAMLAAIIGCLRV